MPYTSVPCTSVPCTSLPCTSVPCTGVPCTGVPCTSVPCTGVPCTSVPCTVKPVFLPREGSPLSLQILSECLLYLTEQVGETLQLPLYIGDVEDVKNQWWLGDLLHETQELCADAASNRHGHMKGTLTQRRVSSKDCSMFYTLLPGISHQSHVISWKHSVALQLLVRLTCKNYTNMPMSCHPVIDEPLKMCYLICIVWKD